MSDNERHECIVRARFVGGKLWNADEESGKFNMVLILDSDKEVAKVKRIRDAAIKSKFGARKPKGMQDWTIREGDDEEFENSFGEMFINPTARNRRPKVYTKKGAVLTEVNEDDNVFYAGCHVFAKVDCFAYPENKEKKAKAGVTMGLQHAVFWKDGDAIGYDGTPDADDYSDMESEDSNGGGYDDDDGMDDLI